MTKLELTEAKKVLWIQIQSRQKEIQLEFRQKCFMLGDMAAAGKLPLALVDTNCQLLDFIHEAIKPLVYQAASLQGAGLDEDIHSVTDVLYLKWAVVSLFIMQQKIIEANHPKIFVRPSIL